MNSGAYAIKPFTPVSQLDVLETSFEFPVFLVSAATGMLPSFIKRVVGRKERLDEKGVRVLLDQDAFGETFVPRSRVLQFLRDEVSRQQVVDATTRLQTDNVLMEGNALDLIPRLPDACIDAVVTSTPYWAMRVCPRKTQPKPYAGDGDSTDNSETVTDSEATPESNKPSSTIPP